MKKQTINKQKSSFHTGKQGEQWNYILFYGRKTPCGAMMKLCKNNKNGQVNYNNSFP